MRGENYDEAQLNKLQSELGYVKKFRNNVEILLCTKAGSGFKGNRSDCVKWKDLATASILNKFLDDTYYVFKSRNLNIKKTNH